MASEEDERKVSTYETYISQPNERTVLLVRGREETWQEKLGLDEPRSLNFWRLVLLEFFVSLLFTLLACGCSLKFIVERSDLHQSLCVGFTVIVLISVSADNSGLFNPALSLGLLISRRIKFVPFIAYVLMQIAGSVAGAGLLYLYTPKAHRGDLGTLELHTDISSGVGFVIEMTLTFVVMWTVCVDMDSGKRNNDSFSPRIIGFSVAVAMLMGMPFTGAAVNPIRAFGPGAVMNQWADHWIYWVGPLTGALLATLTYEFVFTPSREEPKPRSELPTVQLHINANSSNTSV